MLLSFVFFYSQWKANVDKEEDEKKTWIYIFNVKGTLKCIHIEDGIGNSFRVSKFCYKMKQKA